MSPTEQNWVENIRSNEMELHAYVNTKEVQVTPHSYTSKEGRRWTDYSVEIALDDTTKVSFKAYLDEARGLYITSDFSAASDLSKAFLPQIISVATCFTMTEKLDEGVKRELGLYKEGDTEALIEVYKYNKEQLHVTLEGKTLAGINHLWNAIQEGNILPSNPSVKVSAQPAVELVELVKAVSDLRKQLDWALDELTRADRMIASCNASQAEWERISREREEFITELKAQVAQAEQ